MRDVILRICGVRSDAESAGLLSVIWCGLWPLAGPFLILLCAPRWELAAAAACWSVLLVPGLLAVNLFFPPEHPLGRGFGRLGVASMGGLVPFGLVSWPACLLHWRLSTALALYGVVYAVCVVVLVWCLMRLKPAPETRNAHPSSLPVPLDVSRVAAVIIVVGIAVVMVGVWLATLETQEPYRTSGLYAAHGYWWQGTLIGAIASLVVAGLILFATGRRPRTATTGPPPAPRKGTRDKQAVRKRGASSAAGPASAGSRLVILLWAGAAVLTWHVMAASYRLPPSPDDRPRHMYRPSWNSDDVTYVSQAVDCRYGLPLGKYESSIGSDRSLKRADLSPLVAPLVAAISLVTGVPCAALHHSVLPPLIILVGMSALAAALMVVFRGHRWAVPLGTLIAAMMICKSWEYERSMAEFTIWRAMQNRSVHLWLVHPLQLATLVLLAARPDKRHLLWAAAVALVGHLVHPFATILGVVWSATTCGVSVLWQRNALPKVLMLLACYGLLGGGYYAASHAAKPGKGLSTGRVADEPEQSRDLARTDDRPIPRQEPRILFGWNVLFCFGAVATPLWLVLGRKNREFLTVGLLGAVAVAACNVTAVGRLLNVALPMSILWRARWLLPSLVSIALVSFVLYWAFSVVLRRSDRTTTPARSFLACIAAAGMFAVMLVNTSAYAVKLGPTPGRLSKFSADVHGLVELLGGIEADPFVWVPRTVTRELPQLMPNVRLVLSRRKLMLPADDPAFREVVLRTRSIFYAPTGRFRGGRVPRDAHLRAALRQLTELYPIDHFVLDYSTGRGPQGAGVLTGAGWQRIGRSGIYEVWRVTPES